MPITLSSSSVTARFRRSESTAAVIWPTTSSVNISRALKRSDLQRFRRTVSAPFPHLQETSDAYFDSVDSDKHAAQRPGPYVRDRSARASEQSRARGRFGRDHDLCFIGEDWRNR